MKTYFSVLRNIDDENKLSRTFIGIWFVFLIIAALYVRIQGVSDYHYSEDEALHIGLAQGKSLQEVIQFSLYEAHPPLGHVLRYYWMMISDDIGFVRSLSLIFGMLMIPLYYRIGKLLSGKLTGMCCAALTAFSYGCIIQSSVARNYTIFLFFLSAGLNYYLLWRKDKRSLNILLYAVFSILASLTHFAAIFAIASIAFYETVRMFWGKESWKNHIQWILTNILISLAACASYYIWAAYGVVLKGQFFMVSSAADMLLAILANPIKTAEYILPCQEIIPLIIFLLFLPSVNKDKNLKQWMLLTLTAIAVGMLLVAVNNYYPAGTRHGVWALPFIIPASGWILANAIHALDTISRKKFSLPAEYPALVILLLLGFAASNTEAHFSERSEYQIKTNQWKETINYLSALDDKSVLVAARDDAIMFENLYPLLGNAAFSGTVMATVTPYRNTRILFNPYYRRMMTPDILINTLKEAEQRHILDNVGTLVFMKTIWDVFPEPQAPLPYLVTCSALAKEITSFPPFSFPALKTGTTISDEEKKLSPVAFIKVSKKDFFEQVITSEGKAHHCLGDPHAGN